MSRFLTALLASSVLLGAGTANALTISQTVTFGPGRTDYTNNTGNTVFNYFNSTSGTLTSISLSGTYGFNSQLTVSATNSSSGSARTESAANFGASDSAVNSVFANNLDTLGPVTIGQNTLNPAAFDSRGSVGFYSLPPGGSQTFTSNSATSNTGPFNDTNGTDLAAFIGTGAYYALFNTVTGTTTSSTGGNAGATQVTTATGSITLVYNYNAPVTPPTGVPEPASMAILGAGLLGAGLLRRRAK